MRPCPWIEAAFEMGGVQTTFTKQKVAFSCFDSPPLFSFSLFDYTMPRSAWKGPFFVAFPGLRQAIQNGTPIATQGKSTIIGYTCHLFY
jgi:hypothetical protein